MESISTDSTGQNPVGNRTTDQNQQNQCIELLNLVLDNQATSEQKQFFVEHIAKCMPCFESYNLDVEIQKLIQTKCCSESVPADLVASIRSRIIEKID